jgi:hypothetical protein
MQIIVGEHALPLIGDKNSIDPFEHRVCMLIALGKQMTRQVQLFLGRLAEETHELPHEPSIDPVVVLALHMVNHIEVSC